MYHSERIFMHELTIGITRFAYASWRQSQKRVHKFFVENFSGQAEFKGKNEQKSSHNFFSSVSFKLGS